MHRSIKWMLPLLFIAGGLSRAEDVKVTPKSIYETATPSLVAVEYNWVDELKKLDLIGAGIVVDDDMVMFSIGLVSPQIPDEQMKDFKIIVPREDGDPDEIEAVFQGAMNAPTWRS